MYSLFATLDNTKTQTVLDGIHKFHRLLGLIHDDKEEIWSTFADETDLISAVNSCNFTFNDTLYMVDKKKYQGADFDFCRQVKEDMTSILTSGRTPEESRMLRLKNLPMYYLVIQPFIDLFAEMTHVQALEMINPAVEELLLHINANTSVSGYDDAIVAQHQVKNLIRAEEAAKAAVVAKRKRKPSKKASIAELFQSILASTEEDCLEE
jgi:hypothetical protein